MTLTLRSEDAVAAFLEHVADLVRRKLVTGLSIDMHAGRPSRVVIVFAIDPPADEVETLKKIESEG